MARPVISVNQRLQDKYIRHSVFLQQLTKGDAAQVSAFVKHEVFPNIYKKLMAELSKNPNLRTAGSLRKIANFKRTLAALHKISTAGMIRAEQKITKRLVDLSKYEANWNINTIERTVPLDISLVHPSTEVLKTLVNTTSFEGHKMSTWMTSFSASVQRVIVKTLKPGIASGESIPKLGKRVQKVLGNKAYQAQAIARTAASSVLNRTRDKVFKANKKLISKYQWSATLDTRTTMICINYDGKVWLMGEGPVPPAHFNCRSSMVPVITSWQEFGVEAPPAGTRASMNGAVPDKITYKQWLRKQPPKIQNQVLGKARADLYRSGKVRIDRFLDKDMKVLTLKQLAKREQISLGRRTATKRLTAAERVKKAATVKQEPIRLPPLKDAPTETVLGSTFTGLTTEGFKKTMKETLAAFPEKVKLAVSKSGCRMKFGRSMEEIRPDLIGQPVRGWPKGSVWNDTGGGHSVADNSITVSEYTKVINGKRWYMQKNTKGALNHEMGHAFDNTTPDPYARTYSQTEGFVKAYKLDRKFIVEHDNLQPVFGNRWLDDPQVQYGLQAGKAGPQETFSEIFASEMGQRVTDKDMREIFPNCAKWVKDLLAR